MLEVKVQVLCSKYCIVRLQNRSEETLALIPIKLRMRFLATRLPIARLLRGGDKGAPL